MQYCAINCYIDEVSITATMWFWIFERLHAFLNDTVDKITFYGKMKDQILEFSSYISFYCEYIPNNAEKLSD